MCQIAEHHTEILATLFLTPFNLNPPYLMPYQVMRPISHLGQFGHSPQQDMGGSDKGDACSDTSLCKATSGGIQSLHGCLEKVQYTSKGALC